MMCWSDEAKLALVLEGLYCDGIWERRGFTPWGRRGVAPWERRGVTPHILFLSLLFNDAISC
jgi:hypothetical protein